MRIVVLGYIVRGPLGGASWHFIQYLLGFKQLGHQVLFLEDSDNYPSCYNPDTYQTTADCSYGLNFIDRLLRKYDMQDSWSYYDEHTNQWHGRSEKQVRNFCAQADIALSIANMNPLRDWWEKIPIRILLDTDPAFTQMRHIEESWSRQIANQHTHFFTFGENFGNPDCKIPDDGYNWKPTRQPVVINLWEIAQTKPHGRWTTVMLWDSYKVRHYNGLTFGMKSASFDDYFKLPQNINEEFELAIGNVTAPRERLVNEKWFLSDSSTVALTPESYVNYIGQSKGEWSVAKHGYVVSKSGWFSERSVCYLASGKPVIVQDTKFSNFLKTGDGLFASDTLENVLEAINKVNSDYDKHCKLARKVCEEFFDSNKVLNNLLKNI